MSKRRAVLFATSLGAGVAAISLAFLACKPKQIDDTASVTLRFNAGDAGAAGFQCLESNGSAVCNALKACTMTFKQEDIRACFTTTCGPRGLGCDPALMKCIGEAGTGTGTLESRSAALQCFQNVCSVPSLPVGKTIAIVLDYVRLDGVPSCLPNHLVAWCAEKSGTPGVCRPLPNRRRCIPVKLTQSTATSVTAQALERSRELVALLSNSSDSNSSDPFGDKDAPNDQSVIVRVAAIDVAGGCDALTDTTKSLVGTDRKVVGCARSCPVTLDVSQDVALDFGDPTCTHLDDCAELSTPSATP